jgi:hypothetical protein
VLHVTNGDSAANTLAAMELGGRIVPWRDVLHEGPLPAALGPAALREVRARFLAAEGWAREEEALAQLEERDRALEEAAASDAQIVLWFERDLYDQLQLLQVLDRLVEARPRGDGVTLVSVETFGRLAAADLQGPYATREPVTAEAIALGRAAWEAVRSPDPSGVYALAAQDDGVLPGLPAALVRHLEELPGTSDGLSRTERQALEALTAGPRRPLDAFLATAAREERPFLGDTVFLAILARLARGPAPLVRLAGEAGLTRHGEAVLAGDADAVALNGIDRWVGGVHLHTGGRIWRWDPEARMVR